METLIRGIFIYIFLLVVFRISGKRSLASITTFDFVLVLIVSETVQQALLDNDNSMTNAVLLVLTLVGLDILLSIAKTRFPKIARLMDSAPVVIIKEGEILRQYMDKERIDDADILMAARSHQGLSRLDEIDYAVVEQSGEVTVVPKKKKGGG